MRSAPRSLAIAFLMVVAGMAAVGSAPAHALNLPSGFQDETVFTGLEQPIGFRFAADGRVFVGLKKGVIVVFDGVEDDEPTVFADIRTQVFDSGDRGLLSIALDPDFPEQPYIYALYAYDHVLGEPGGAPKWGEPNHGGDACPLPEGADVDTCPVSGRLVRMEADGDHAVTEEVGGEAVPKETTLVEDWCQQFSSHSVGDLEFGPDGALYASAGEGSNFNSADYGQFGWPETNMCGDPPGGVGGGMSPPDAEGGALRAQDARTLADPMGLDATVIRVDPDTGEGLPGNPMYASLDPNARRIIGFGFRNPFRFAIDSRTSEVYVGNVGWFANEEVDRLSATPSVAYNSGWPCIEGSEPVFNYMVLELDICEAIYEEPGSTAPPFFSYDHGGPVTPDDPCPTEFGATVSALEFYRGGKAEGFPESFGDALFFSDPVRQCIYVMFAGEDDRPDPSTAVPFLTEGGVYPGIDIQEGLEGALYYTKLFADDFGLGSIHRIAYHSGNEPPVAELAVDHEWGPVPLITNFDASGSSDAEAEDLEFEWDLDGDGTYGDAPSQDTASETFNDSQNHVVSVRVLDEQGASSVARITVYPGDTPPSPEIVNPSPALEWHVGQPIHFEGGAEDDEDGALPATSLDWSSRLSHCPSACHVHPLQAFPAVDSGTLIAPDHDYPALISLVLTAADSRGLAVTETITIDPHPVELTIDSEPPGVELSAGEDSGVSPFVLTAIEDSHVTLTAPATAQLGETTYVWEGWSDEGERVHTIEAGAPATYTAEYGGPIARLTVSQHWDEDGHLEAEFDASASSGAGAEPEYEWKVGAGEFEGPPSLDPTKTIPIEDEEPHVVAVRVIAPGGNGNVAEETVSAVELEIESEPAGAILTAGEVTGPAPFSLFALEGFVVQLAALENQDLGGVDYEWSSWSDGDSRVHTVEVGGTHVYGAKYTRNEPPQESPGVQPFEDVPSPLGLLPQTSIRRHPLKRGDSTSARFVFSSSQPGARFNCKLDGKPFRPCRSPKVYKHLRPGRHVFRVVALADGMADPTPSIFKWKVL